MLVIFLDLEVDDISVLINKEPFHNGHSMDGGGGTEGQGHIYISEESL